MKRSILFFLLGLGVGVQVHLWDHPEVQSIGMYVAKQAINASHYVARTVSEDGLPYRGYSDGYRRGYFDGSRGKDQLRNVRYP